MVPADGEGRPVQLQGGVGVAGLLGDGQLAPGGGLRQPAAAAAESVGVALRGPRYRHAAAVPQTVLPVGLGAVAAAEERGVLPHLVGQVGDFGQPEFLALVDVGGAGQGQHQQGRGAGPRQAAAEPGAVAHDVVVGQHPRGGGADGPHRVERGVDDAAQPFRVPRGVEVVEVERLVQFVGAHVQRGAVGGGGPRLRHADARLRILVEDLAPGAVDVVHAVLVEEGQDLRAQELQLFGVAHVGQPGGLDQAMGHVDAEAVDAHVEPEAQQGAELVLHGPVLPVEVGLLRGEEVQVPLAGGAVGVVRAGPGRAAEDGLPVVGRQFALLPAAGPEVVPGAQRRAGAFAQRAPEPFVPVGGVVGNEVDDDPQAQVVGVADEGVGVVQIAEHRVDGAVVGDVVARVGLRGGVERAEPDGVDAEAGQVRQPAADAGQVAHAVAVTVGEGPRVHLVDDRVAPPVGPAAGDACGVAGRLGAVGEVLGHVIPESVA